MFSPLNGELLVDSDRIFISLTLATSYYDKLLNVRRTEELYCLTHTLKAFCLFLKKVKFKYKLCFRAYPSEYLKT